ncbi:cytochrome b561-like protein [Isoptericola jiangsuensis]|uniref:Cytochrome b561-like protein n=1 Tax=Isoptericola jiangsuensis TaxID=548579 RepID=A0A2A9EZ00_9MICO|nr:cytochrome b/b6 domain-containing protein [Isoptericola jiangsuensis]PFG43532.1 cytochrome b561-like protein [Isoptericola jiangsuensis]
MTRVVRRGLPRVPGGEPWPPATTVTGRPEASSDEPDDPAAAPVTDQVAVAATVGAIALRRGLPRVAGGEPWPPAGLAPARVVPPATEPVAAPGPESGVEPVAGADLTAAASAPTVVEPAGGASAPTDPESAPIAPTDAGAPRQDRPAVPALPAWVLRTVRPAATALAVLVVAVILARWLVGLAPVRDFLATYDGTAPMPADAPVGIPAWLAWQHFFNLFLLVLVVRTGLQVRRERQPAAYWAPRSDPSAKIGLSSWTHQSLDVLWVANGVVYVVLLFATGQWVRIVPTSWSVVPEAASAALQYLALDWPTENGWIHYNGLQQLTYFVTVFVAAPLAVATGVRMSRYWRSTATLDRVLPVHVARRVHFPVMVYFVAFVVTHVGLVLATGALRNLNHMFAGRDDTGWVGLGVFALAVVVVVGAAAALRPVLVAPVARRLGTVTSR